MAEVAKWYVIHTYSGYEKKVETNIAKLIENRGMHEQITDIRVPVVVSIDPETKKESKRKHFPGYVFIKMIMYLLSPKVVPASLCTLQFWQDYPLLQDDESHGATFWYSR